LILLVSLTPLSFFQKEVVFFKRIESFFACFAERKLCFFIYLLELALYIPKSPLQFLIFYSKEVYLLQKKQKLKATRVKDHPR